jgi:hypothetical protein
MGPRAGLDPVQNRNFRTPAEKPRPPLWSSGQNSWLQIQRSRVRFCDVFGLERAPLSFVRRNEELLE